MNFPWLVVEHSELGLKVVWFREFQAADPSLDSMKVVTEAPSFRSALKWIESRYGTPTGWRHHFSPALCTWGPGLQGFVIAEDMRFGGFYGPFLRQEIFLLPHMRPRWTSSTRTLALKLLERTCPYVVVGKQKKGGPDYIAIVSGEQCTVIDLVPYWHPSAEVATLALIGRFVTLDTAEAFIHALGAQPWRELSRRYALHRHVCSQGR